MISNPSFFSYSLSLENMVSSSVSLPSPTSSFPSTSNNYSFSNSTSLFTFNLFKPYNNHRFSKPLKYPSLKLSSCSSTDSVEDRSVEQFLKSNSIADFMRFKQGSHKGSDKLQTAIVSYRKRFPWSILYPFLRVDLISTIHISDTEYFETLQKELAPYDCVLYEIVASRESLKNRWDNSFNILLLAILTGTI